MQTHQPGNGSWELAGRFVDGLAGRDFAAIGTCLDPGVRMRALVPRGPFEIEGPAAVVERLERWFGGEDAFELLDASIGEVGPRLALRWRVRMTGAGAGAGDRGAARVAEQHAFVTTGRLVEALDLLCSGFVPETVLHC